MDVKTESKSEQWWRIEVLAWIPFMMMVILLFLITQNISEPYSYARVISLVLNGTLVLALIPKAIKCHYLGLKRSFFYGGLCLLLIINLFVIAIA
ncbi:hypothetical protein [Bacillus sp. Marseille-P3800]|uniref:hypothetical protein n=1 Tax=Bacillus sp. Marseille-P3800 TaxID=2014782 RepID=UPI000C074E6E|nr:hypothetical protein [Bacillus sp. Marseille-P3800]